MAWTRDTLIGQLGQYGGNGRRKSSPVVITASETDPDSGTIIALKSLTTYDRHGNPRDATLQYWSHLGCDSQDQTLIRARFQPPGPDGRIRPDEIWYGTAQIFSATRGDDLEDPVIREKVNGVIGGLGRATAMVRNREPIRNLAKLLIGDCRLGALTGESLPVKGLDAEKGGFKPRYLGPIFMQATSLGRPVTLRKLSADMLQTVMGFPVNTIDHDRDFGQRRQALLNDPMTGIVYAGSAEREEGDTGLRTRHFIKPVDYPANRTPQEIPKLVAFQWAPVAGEVNSWQLEKTSYLDERQNPADLRDFARHVGFNQACNLDLANNRYPLYADHADAYGLSSKYKPLPPPKPLSEGGEFNYTSLMGCSREKRLENFGDQIGTSALFLHCGLEADGSDSTVGCAVDWSLAIGGPDSGYDGMIPDNPFLPQTKIIALSHNHFDHDGGIAPAIAKGMLVGKTIVIDARHKYRLDRAIKNLRVPRHLWPQIKTIEGEGAIPIEDDKGRTRLWLQYRTNAMEHTTPVVSYAVTGCVNDDHYNGTVLIPGDGRGPKPHALDFFKEGIRRLPAQAAQLGKTVSPDKLGFTLALLDSTSVADKGRSPTVEDIEPVWDWAMEMAEDFGVLVSPISTNSVEYNMIHEMAHRHRRDEVAVGGNAEVMLSQQNLFGVDPDLDLRTIRIEPLDAAGAPNPLIPPAILKSYLKYADVVARRTHIAARVRTTPVNEDTKEVISADKVEARALRLLQKDLREKLLPKKPASKREHEIDVHAYIADNLIQHGAVLFENDINGAFMFKAVRDGKEYSSLRYTRVSGTGKDLRQHPGGIIIPTTGSQGTTGEQFSSMSKAEHGVSLFDVDEAVRRSGYSIDFQDYVLIDPQTPINGNEDAYQRRNSALAYQKNFPVFTASRHGLVVHNPGRLRERIVGSLKTRGWSFRENSDASISVFGKDSHWNGHGREDDFRDGAKQIGADMFMLCHIPNATALRAGNALLDAEGLPRCRIEPDDHKVFAIDQFGLAPAEKVRVVGHLHPAYNLLRYQRTFGYAYGGSLDMTRVELARREGLHRDDGMLAACGADGVLRKSTARISWDAMTNPAKYKGAADFHARNREMGPSPNDRSPLSPPRGRPLHTDMTAT